MTAERIRHLPVLDEHRHVVPHHTRSTPAFAAVGREPTPRLERETHLRFVACVVGKFPRPV
jgi:hypothetical protein